MDSVDLNISNYSFDDILTLFKLDKNFTEDQLIKCKEVVNKLNPTNSTLNIKYYNLFNSAYNKLEEHHKLQSLKEIPVINPEPFQSGLNAFYNKTMLLKDSCYSPYLFSTRMVTIHTEDRDILKYPLENVFEVEFPSTIKNTLSIELFDITLPTFYYNISEYLQNTKFWFSLPFYFTTPVEVTIPYGYYTYDELAAELTIQINAITTQQLYNLGAYVDPTTQYTYFTIKYNANQRRFTFENTQDNFILWFDKVSKYDDCLFDSWKMFQNWGLGYNLGFYKEKYTAIFDNTDPSLNLYYITSPKIADLELNNTIYMEIDTYNWIDELTPFSISTTDYYNNDFNGSVNNSFAKLILSNVTKCYVPVEKFQRILPHIVEKIARLKFRFRYHNGILVDFMHQPFNFSLKFECRFDCKT